MNEHRRGALAGVIDTLLWASTVLYWPHLAPASDTEILGQRLVWACLIMLALLAVSGRFGSYLRVLRDRRTALLLVGAALSITFNWAGFIWGVTHDHVLEASLGFFISPLVTVLLGIVVLREKVRRLQTVALGLVVVAVVVVTASFGGVPWFALAMAVSGGLYGMFKKQAHAGALESLAVETSVVAPIALVWLVVNGSAGHSTFLSHGAAHALLLVGGGLVTVTPLIFFGYAAGRVPLVLLGVIGYLAPTGTFVLGLAYFHESLPGSQVAGYVLVWAALVIFGVDSFGAARGPSAPVPAAQTVTV
jgi:chloramphenicol-sensitive protein RarD